MKTNPAIIWDAWTKGGPFVGELRPTGRVTVEWNWFLHPWCGFTGNYPHHKKPIRGYQVCDDSQAEMELPPIKSISIDRSIDADAGTCTIVLYNQKMKTNEAPQNDLNELGQPGYYTVGRGQSPRSNARWKNQYLNEWCYALGPNSLLRTYQGYGGRIEDMSIDSAVGTGYLTRTGVWFVDKTKITSDGLITLECRDAAKLLIEQQLYPPLVPHCVYPLRYCRFNWVNETIRTVIPGGGERQITVANSGVDMWYPKGNTGSGLPAGYVLHGHRAQDSIDGNHDTFALSVGNSHPDRPFCADWWEYNVNGPIDSVDLFPWGGNYTMYVSILENGQWLDESGEGTIPYDAGPLYGNQPYVVNTNAGIPFVRKFGIPWEAGGNYKLPRTYQAEKIRITFRGHTKTQWGPWFYRCGIRQVSVKGGDQVTERTELVRRDGNYKDYADIVKDLLLWAGFWCWEPLAGARANETPHVHGNIESTGIWAEECLPDDLFDKRPVIDPITELKETVGYITWVDDEGAFHFESPNWWSIGNFTETGERTAYMPEIDEALQLVNYTCVFTDENLRSEIIIASENSRLGPQGVVTRYRPDMAREAGFLRGITKTAMWTNGYFTNKDEQKLMAELIALHIRFRTRQGSVTAWANPCIQINDQVRIYERVSAEVYIHYVRGVSTEMDCDTGSYTMTLNTHYIGGDGGIGEP